MARTELIVVGAALLFAAFLAGFFAHWLIARLARGRPDGVEAAEPLRPSPAREEAVHADHDRELAEARADAKAARDALQIARMEADELRAHLNERRSGNA